MRIVMVSSYPPLVDGIGIHTRNIVRALGPEVSATVLTRRAPGESDDPGVARVLSASPAALWRGFAALRRVEADIVHFQYNIPALGLAWVWAVLAGVAARALRGPRLVFTLHEVRRDVTLLGPAGRWTFRLICAIADAVVVYTDEARTILERRCGVSSSKITVMAHGAPDAFATPGDDDRSRLAERYGIVGEPLLFVGYIHPDKGIEHLVDAVALLERDRPEILGDTAVVIAGAVRQRRGAFRFFEAKDRAYEASLHDRVTRHGLGQRVRFVGHVADEDLPPLMKSASAAVLPYTDATQSGVLNLLMAAATPIVASRLPGLEETLGATGSYFAPGDATALATELAALLGDGALRQRLAREMAARHARLTFAVIASDLARLYGAVLADSTRTAGCAH